MKVSTLFIGMIGFLVSQLQLALAVSPEIQLKGAVRTNSCGYYSSTVGNFSFAYGNDDLPWGTKVVLHYGYQVHTFRGNQSVTLTWQDQKKIEMGSVSDFVWGAYIKESIHYRGKPSVAPDAINFAFEVILPNGESFWEKGTDAYPGHYTGFWHYSSVKCVDGSTPDVVLEDLIVEVSTSTDH